MKKKILFMLINMNVGGTEKALLNMISEIPKEIYDVTILMLEEYGGFLNSIPSNVNVEYFKGYKDIKDIINNPPHLAALEFFKNGEMIKAFIIVILYFLTKITNNRNFFFKYVLYKYPKIKKEYDIAVAYDGPMDFISYFVMNKILAKKKIQWIHFDITHIGFNPKYAAKLYSKFEKIFVVSEEAKKKLINAVPTLWRKSEVFYNIVSSEIISHQAKEGSGFTDNFTGLRILTVGRLSTEKGQDLAIKVLARLIDEGYNIKWYCVGEGSLRQKYEKLISEHYLEDRFILLGAHPNPYSFIEECDIYVQPSRHEGYCITLAEARCLRKPIVTTNFITAKEQINHGENGLIATFNENEIYKAIVDLITNEDLCKKFSNNLKKERFESKQEMDKLFSLL